MINRATKKAILHKEVDSCGAIPVVGKPGARGGVTGGITTGATIGSIVPVSIIGTTGTTGGTITTGVIAQLGTLIVSISVVIVQPNDNADHSKVLLAPMVIPAASIMIPRNVVFAPSVVAAPGVQNTLHEEVPPVRATIILGAVLNAPLDLKMNVPPPLSMIPGVELIDIAPITQYTPEV